MQQTDGSLMRDTTPDCNGPYLYELFHPCRIQYQATSTDSLADDSRAPVAVHGGRCTEEWVSTDRREWLGRSRSCAAENPIDPRRRKRNSDFEKAHVDTHGQILGLARGLRRGHHQRFRRRRNDGIHRPPTRAARGENVRGGIHRFFEEARDSV